MKKNLSPKEIDYFNKIFSAKNFLNLTFELKNIEKMQIICDAIKKTETLKRITIIYEKIGKEGMNLLCEALKINNSITTIELDASRIGKEEFSTFCDLVREKRDLRKLEFSNFYLSKSYFLNSIKENGCFEEISLQFIYFDESEMNHLNEVLLRNPKLKILRLQNNKINKKKLEILLKHINNSSIERLSLRENEIEGEGVEKICKILENNKTMKEIDISKAFFIPKESYKHFVSTLKINNTLETLIYEENNSYHQEIKLLLECNKEWSPSLHSSLFKEFRSTLKVFLFCLREYQCAFNFKIPKYVVFEIIKRIDRKSYHQFWSINQKEN